MINVEIAYANNHEQCLLSVKLPENSTVEQAIQSSDILNKFPEIKLFQINNVGIFGKLCKPQTVLHTGDRVEIYRPLLIDTMERRLKKVKAARVKHARK